MFRKQRWYFQFLLNSLLAITLVFGSWLAVNPEWVWAGSGILAAWRMQSWTASSGTPANLGVALLSTNTTNPFYTSTGAPPGESNVFISYDWANGSGVKCWKVHFISTGFQNLTVSSQQMSTDLGFGTWNGPRDFKLQYSLDDSTWVDVPGGTLTLGSTWIASGRLTNLSLPSALNNQPDAYLRWIMTSNASVSPTYPTTDSDAQSMIGGIYINGDEIPVAPTDILLSNNTLAGSDPPGTLVGTLSAVDANAYDTWTYSLVSGTGDTDNASFIVAGNRLSNTVSLAPGAYSIRVNVNDGTYDLAKPFAITVSAYSPITGGDTQYGDYIDNVTFAGINNTSGDDDGYADYTAFTAAVVPGGSPQLTTTIMLGDSAYPAIVVAWIDWNRNYSFDDAGERYVVGTNLGTLGANTAITTINVPLTATAGTTRMRIVMDANDGTTIPPNSGNGVFYGDAEDYTIQVNTATCTSTGSSAWGSSSTWTCGHVPDGNESVTIAAGHTVALGSNVTQNGAIVLDGDIDAGIYVLTLGSGVTLTGAGDVIGTVRRTNPGTGSALQFNNRYTTLNFTTAPTQMDVTLVRTQPSGFGYAVDRTYTLTTVGSAAATLRLHYKDAELHLANGATENSLSLFRHNGSAWVLVGRSAGDATENWVEYNNVTTFSSWTISGNTPTFVTLHSLSSRTIGNSITTFWLIAAALLVTGKLVVERRKRTEH
ncbi:MAG: hypothetical protein JXA21_24145 [Anaerolineae bacterium]|nr:hypothetical protein [Anaerolineae bacterium]